MCEVAVVPRSGVRTIEAGGWGRAEYAPLSFSGCASESDVIGSSGAVAGMLACSCYVSVIVYFLCDIPYQHPDLAHLSYDDNKSVDISLNKEFRLDSFNLLCKLNNRHQWDKFESSRFVLLWNQLVVRD
jgi:hypothetical protein